MNLGSKIGDFSVRSSFSNSSISFLSTLMQPAKTESKSSSFDSKISQFIKT